MVKRTTPSHPIISRDWNGQTHFKRTTNTNNLVPLDSPFAWHERLMGQVLLILTRLARHI